MLVLPNPFFSSTFQFNAAGQSSITIGGANNKTCTESISSTPIPKLMLYIYVCLADFQSISTITIIYNSLAKAESLIISFPKN